MSSEPASPSSGARGTGRGTRVAITLQVALTLALALAAVLLVDWLSEQPGLRVRGDLTRDEQNTLKPQTLEVLERLPVDVTIDVFFNGRALEGNLESIGYAAQEHARRTIRLVQEASGGKITTESHDLLEKAGTQTSAMSRLRELSLREVEPGGVVVVSAGTSHQVLHLRGDLCDIDPGVPPNAYQESRAPRLVALRAEEALVSALHKVASQTRPKTLFTIGHGELDTQSTDPGGAAQFRAALEADGFQVDVWDLAKDGRIPDACQVLFVLGPEQPFTQPEIEEVARFVESGGRLLLAPSDRNDFDGAGSIAELAVRFGVQVSMLGLVAQKVPQSNGELLEGLEACGYTVIFSDGLAAQNPATESLRRAGRRVYVPFTRKLARADTFPKGANLIPILRTDPDTWFDLADRTRKDAHDWTKNPAEETGPFAVAMQVIFPTSKPVPSERAIAGGRPETRVCAIGSSAAFTNWVGEPNRDFLLNVSNWISAREYRVHVEANSPEARRLEITQVGVLSRIQLLAVWLVPGLCLALGLLTAWRRSR